MNCNRKKWEIIVLLCIVMVILIGCYFFSLKTQVQTSVLGWSDVVLDAYEMELRKLDEDVFQDNGKDYTNYWVMAANGIHYIRNDDIYEATTILETLMGTFDRYGKFPREEYQNFDYGWVSCMDAPTVAVLAQMLYEETGESKYKYYVDNLTEYMILENTSGGYTINYNNKKWLLEYCGQDTTVSNAEFVLNGSLVGTLGTYLVASATDNKTLLDIVSSQCELYKQESDPFWYRDNAWCYYMMGEGKEVDQDHYVIFEIRLFKALYGATGDSYFEEQANKRVDMMKQYYQLFLDEDDNWYFIRGGAPHYYYIDIYSTKLLFVNEEGKILKIVEQSGREFENSLMKGVMPKDTSGVYWIITTDYYSVDMGKLEVNLESSGNYDIITDGNSMLGDVNIEGSHLSYIGDLNTTKINLSGQIKRDINYSEIYAIEMTSNIEELEYGMNIVLYDSAGNAISRYLPELLYGKNLIVFSVTGFKENESKHMNDIDNFCLRVYLNEGESLDIDIGNVYCFRNSMELYQYLDESDFTINFGNN